MALFWIWVSGPGKKLQESLGGEIGSLFFLIVIFVSLTLFWKRAFTAFIGFALFAMSCTDCHSYVSLSLTYS